MTAFQLFKRYWKVVGRGDASPSWEASCHFLCVKRPTCHSLNLYRHLTSVAARPSSEQLVAGNTQMLLHTISLCFPQWTKRSSHWIPAVHALLHCCGDVAKTSVSAAGIHCEEVSLLFIACSHFSCIKLLLLLFALRLEIKCQKYESWKTLTSCTWLPCSELWVENVFHNVVCYVCLKWH